MTDNFAIGNLVLLLREPEIVWEIIANKSQPYTDDFMPPQTKQWGVAQGADYLLKMTLKSQREKNGFHSEKLEPYVSARESDIVLSRNV